MNSTTLLILNRNQIDTYNRDGFIQINSTCSLKEIETWREESSRLWKELIPCRSNKRLQWRESLTVGEVADRIDPLIDISLVFNDLANDSRFIDIATDLIGKPSMLFKAKLISKWPGTHGYQMHQDYTYWNFVGDVPADDFVTLVVALDNCDGTSGGLELFPGLHHQTLAPPNAGALDVDENQIDLTKGHLAKLSPGDILLFHGLTPHRSGINQSNKNRECLFFTYVCADHESLYKRYYEDRPQDWLQLRKNTAKI